MSYLESLQPVRTESGTPIFDINGREWTGWLWDRGPADVLPRELRCIRGDGLEVSIKEGTAGFYAKLAYRSFSTTSIEKGKRFATFEEAQSFALDAEFKSREVAGVKWYLVIEDEGEDGHAVWEAVLKNRDKGVITYLGKSRYSIARKVWIGSAYLEMTWSGYDLDNEDTRIKTFEDAAIACLNLFAEVGKTMGGDDYQRGVTDGREEIKAKMLAMLLPASSDGGMGSVGENHAA